MLDEFERVTSDIFLDFFKKSSKVEIYNSIEDKENLFLVAMDY